jgi:hypothetical protein
MNIFDQLSEIYNEIDSSYATIEVVAHSKGHHNKEADYFAKRKLNDQAYFLFMFTRLEDRIRSLSDQLIAEKMTILTDWKSKRSWEIIQKQKVNDTLHFMNRVSLLTPKGGRNFNLIKIYYDQRNNIGHGGTFTITISIPKVITDMKQLYKNLKD